MATVHSLPSQPPTRVADGEHLTHLLDEAQGAVNRGDSELAITHLAQGVLVAATKETDLSELVLIQRVRAIIESGGRVA